MGRRIAVGMIAVVLIFVSGCDNPLYEAIKDHVTIFNSETGLLVRNSVTSAVIARGETHSYGDIGTSRNVEVVFSIENTGELDLTIEAPVTVRNPSVVGTYTITQQPPATVAAGSSAEFRVEYAPIEPGNCNAEVVIPYSITSSDEYVFNVDGTGVFRGITAVDNIGTLYGYADGMGDIVVDGDTVIICYYNTGQLKLATSTDGGYSWVLQSPAFGSGADYECSLALSGTTLYLAYRDSADDIRFARSSNLGTSWDSTSIDTSVFTGTTDGSISIDSYGNTVHIAFADGNSRLIRSTNRGESWQSVITINPHSGAGSPNDLVASDGQIVMNYYDMTDHGCWIERYGTYGSTGSRLENSKNDSGMTGVGIAQFNNHVYVTYAGEYQAGGAPDYAVFFQHSSDGGGTWLPTPVAVEFAGLDNWFPRIVSNGTYVYLCYFDNSSNRLRFQRSGDHGTNWDSDAEIEKNVDSGDLSTGSYEVVKAEGDCVYIAYFDNNELLLAKSMDCGVSW